MLETQRMPTLRNEEYRFTDVSRLLRTEAQVFHYYLDTNLGFQSPFLLKITNMYTPLLCAV